MVLCSTSIAALLVVAAFFLPNAKAVYKSKADSSPKYLLTLPQTWRPSQDFAFHLVLFENSNYSLPVSFTANLSTSDVIISSQTFQQNTYGLQKHVFQNLKTANLPNGDDIWPTISVAFDTTGLAAQDDAMSSWPSKVPETFLFIQTDKSLYKPGQNVKIRVLGLARDLKSLAKSGNLTVTVSDPNGNTIRQWTEQNLQNGLLALNFTTSDMASLGGWTVGVEGGQLPAASKSFTIQQYVLPKFEVSLDFPSSYWLMSANQSGYKGYVRAKYTFGKPVRGKAVVVMTSTGFCSYRYDYRSSWSSTGEPVPPVLNKTVTLAGDSSSNDGEFTMEGLNEVLMNTQSTSCQLSLTVNMTEDLTNEMQTSSGSVTIYKFPYAIKVHESVQKTLKPGLPFTMRLQVTKPDGSPLNENLAVIVNVRHDASRASTSFYDYYRSPMSICDSNLNDTIKNSSDLFNQTFTLTTDADGLVDVTVTPPLNLSQTVFYAYLVKEPSVTVCETRTPPNTVSNQSVSIVFDRPLSKSDAVIKVGDLVNFKIYVTFPTSYVYFVVSQSGQPFTYQKITQPVSSDPTGVTAFSASVTLPKESAPQASALVWTIEPGSNEVLADAIQFKVDGVFSQIVSASFSPKAVRPGEPATLTVKTTDPNSTVALLAVDKSVHLLSSGNDITQDDVLNSVFGFVQPGWWPWWVDSSSANSVFQTVGMTMYSNAITAQETLYWGYGPVGEVFRRGQVEEQDDREARGQVVMSQAPMAPVSSAFGRGAPMKKEAEAPVRKNFPETWIWQIVQTGPTGQIDTSLEAPDTITTWLVSALAVGSQNGFGALNSSAELTVFQDFFVNLDISHPTIIREEQVEIKGVVFNYRSDPLTVNLLLKQSPDFEMSMDGGKTFASQKFSQQLQVLANGGSSIPIWIKAKKLGKINLEFSGTATVGDAAVKDAMRKEVTVEAEGEVKYANKPMLIRFHDKIDSVKQTISIEDILGASANSVVNGSKFFQLQVVGDILGPSLKNLGSQIRLPTGCGEQTMITLAPNVYIYKYLQSAGILSPDLASQAVYYVNDGYNRELGFQRNDSGFSAFGNNDKASSTWLTAFVLRSFHAALKYMNTAINPDVLTKTWGFLKSQANSNGTFQEPGNVIHSDMKGGATSDINLAAYIYTTYAETGGLEQCRWDSLTATRSYIISAASDPNNKDPYQLALAAYALSILPDDKSTSLQILSRLISLATNKNGGMSWDPPVKNDSSSIGISYFHRTETNEIEMAAYALLAMMSHGQTDNAISVARFLMSKRNSLGGFGSTQDTVVGLQALSEVAPMLMSGNSSVDITATLRFREGDVSTSFHIDKTNSQILQSFDPDRSRQSLKSVDISAKGSGTILLQLAVRYNVQNRSLLDSGDFSIVVVRRNVARRRRQVSGNDSVSADDSAVSLQACTNSLSEAAKRGMVLLELGIPTGFDTDLDGTRQANKANNGTSQFDAPLKKIESGDRKIVFYFDSVTDNTCVTAKMTRTAAAKNVQPPMVRVYAYYSPAVSNAASYSFVGMSSA